ncbi:MAG: hypothetical protein KBC38_00090 [Candidatus Pacebacteria bacterium]|nr:hypothetical protein [Candidatus Paceibacterota bacterium]MBP9840402.1 hypothetical protein [Candidatus Paceibacterota bacterium]
MTDNVISLEERRRELKASTAIDRFLPQAAEVTMTHEAATLCEEIDRLGREKFGESFGLMFNKHPSTPEEWRRHGMHLNQWLAAARLIDDFFV